MFSSTRPTLKNVRVWHCNDGRTIEGSVQVHHGNNVELLSISGEIVEVPIIELRRDDLALLLAPPKSDPFVPVMAAVLNITSLWDEPLSLNPQNFNSIAASHYPIMWPAEQFCGQLNGPRSQLKQLLQANVTHAASYREAETGHSYSILCVESNISSMPNHNIWLRCQRTPRLSSQKPIFAGLHKFMRTFHKTPAADSVKFSFDESTLLRHSDASIASFAFECVQLQHVVSLLRILHSTILSYETWLNDSLCYTDALLQTLDLLDKPGDYISPRTDSPGAIRGSTLEVAKQFLQKWEAKKRSEGPSLSVVNSSSTARGQSTILGGSDDKELLLGSISDDASLNSIASKEVSSIIE